MAVRLPDAPQRDAQPQLEHGLPALMEEEQRRAEVVVLPLELLEPLGLVRPGRLRLGQLRELEEVGAVSQPYILFLCERAEVLECVLTDCFEHRHAWVRSTLASSQALLHDAGYVVEHRTLTGITHGL